MYKLKLANKLSFVTSLEVYVFHALLLFIVLGLSACHKEQEETPSARGDILSDNVISSYDTALIRQFISGVGTLQGISLKYKVAAVKILYLTTDAQGTLVQASGVVMVPFTGGPFPLLSIQHGTIAEKIRVASVNPVLNEGIIGLITASEGYVTCIPDYLGLGDSEGLHPYLVADVLAVNVVDMLRAVRSYLKKENMEASGQLFLTGYSEGGYVTLAAHREIEQHESGEFTVTASAPMAGPYNMKAIIDTLLSKAKDSYADPAFIAYFLTAYNDVYGWNRLEDIFKEPYAALIPELFDGMHTISEIDKQLPVIISELIRPEFIEGYLNGIDYDLLQAVQENTLLGWGPAAPIRFFHGDSDLTVPYRNAVITRQDLLAHGATHVDLVNIEGGTHASSIVDAFTGMVHWFDSIRIR